MRKYFVFIVLVLPIYAMGENVIFNPGFDMTPWDTGWTIETDTATNRYGGICTETAMAQVMPDTSSSLPNSCYLETVAWINCSPGGAAAQARATISQTFNEIPACTVKMKVKCWWSLGFSECGYGLNPNFIEVRINNIWQKIWERVPDSYYGGDTTWKEIVIGISSPISGIRLQASQKTNLSEIG
ncbi:MAG: hypothetical protein HY769_08015 [Candidatus Stahlbacteria bacterium]|nr:hypothetical protein [Candidatus Stahlbacteria bacterium]